MFKEGEEVLIKGRVRTDSEGSFILVEPVGSKGSLAFWPDGKLRKTDKQPSLFSASSISHPPLSRRDWFAGMAMQCLYNADSRGENNIPELIRLISEYSVNIADAMLAELDKEK